jgi:putative flippase GtrA
MLLGRTQSAFQSGTGRNRRMMQAHVKPFLLFGLIGVVGFAVDAGALYLALGLGIGPYLGRFISYLCAATATWGLNRRLTFRDRAGRDRAGRDRAGRDRAGRGRAGKGTSPLRQWLAFLAANAVGGGVNLGVYSAVVGLGPKGAAMPLLGVALGSLGGWVFNYALSHRFVFRD